MSELHARERRRNEIVQQLEQMIEAAGKEGRNFTTDETEKYNTLTGQVTELDEMIQREQQVRGLRHGDGTPPEQRGGAHLEDPAIGLTDKETQRFSILRAIRSMLKEATREDIEAAAFERECSRAVEQRLGRPAKGMFVPWEVQTRTVLTKGTVGTFGYLAPDEKPTSYIEMLRNKMMVRAAGARVLLGLTGDLPIPRMTSGATLHWVAEDNAGTISNMGGDQLELTPQTATAFSDLSRKLIIQSSFDVEQMVMDDFAQVMALGIDYGCLHGRGHTTYNELPGIAGVSGIGSVAGGTDGGAPTWDDIVRLETEVSQDNADIGNVAYMTNAKVRGKLKATPKVATYGEQMIWGEGQNPLNGYPCHVTNQVASTLTKNSSGAVCSAIFFGNWGDLLIGFFSGLDILVDPYTNSTKGTVRIIAMQDVDAALRHAESMAAMLDALTTA